MNLKRQEVKETLSKVFGKEKMRLFIKKNLLQQDMTKHEYLKAAVSSLIIITIIAIVFYRSLAAVPLLMPIGILYYKGLIYEIAKKKQHIFRKEFKDMIQILAANLSVGYSFENALIETKAELLTGYKAESKIIKETDIILRQLSMNISEEIALTKFADRAGLEDVKSFAAVFVSAKRSGGNLIDIITDTTVQIAEKQEVEKEIETILTAKKYEFRVMTIIPFLIIGYMSVSFRDFMNPLYGNLLGIGVMTICLIVYVFAYYIGLKIVTIEI